MLLFVCVSVWAYAYECRCLGRPETSGLFRTGITGSCELPDMGAENWVLCKSNMYTLNSGTFFPYLQSNYLETIYLTANLYNCLLLNYRSKNLVSIIIYIDFVSIILRKFCTFNKVTKKFPWRHSDPCRNSCLLLWLGSTRRGWLNQ